MKKETKKNPFENQEESNWHPAEIRRRDIQKLLENTKKLAETYSGFLQIKREAWEKMLKSILCRPQQDHRSADALALPN